MTFDDASLGRMQQASGLDAVRDASPRSRNRRMVNQFGPDGLRGISLGELLQVRGLQRRVAALEQAAQVEPFP